MVRLLARPALVNPERNSREGQECFTPTFLDYDLDGDLDLYICRYGRMGLRSIISCKRS